MEKSKNNGDIASPVDVYFLGISSVISGMFTFWNIGFAFGFWEFCFATVFISIAYFALVMCLAEMISILPFSGGSYGFSRVTMGPYFGFLIGCFDSMSLIIFIAILVRSCVDFITYAVGPSAPLDYDPLFWFLLYFVCLAVLIPLGHWHFRLITAVGLFSIVMCIVFALATIPNQNFEKNVTYQERHRFFQDGGMSSFMQVLPISTWMYIGIDLICLVCDDTKDAVHVVPKALIYAMVTLIVLAFLLLVTSAANSPGVLALSSVAFPLNAGYSAAFKISDRVATILSLPTIIMNIYAVIYAYGRQICALSRSKLLPSFLSWTTQHNVPFMADIFGCLLGFIILLGLYYNNSPLQMQLTLNYLYNAAQMGSFTVYIVSMLSFIIFRYKYSSLERHFVNGLGVPSAIVGIIIFLFAFIGVAFFQEDQYQSVVYYTVFVAAMSVYYFAYARHKQCFSPEEQSILFAAYIIKTNGRKKTLWSRLGRKLFSVVERADPHHRVSEFLSGFSQGGHSHSHSKSQSRQSRGSHSPQAASGGSPEKGRSIHKESSIKKQSDATDPATTAGAAPGVIPVDDEGITPAEGRSKKWFFSSSKKQKTAEDTVSPTATATAAMVGDEVCLFESELDETVESQLKMKSSAVITAGSSHKTSSSDKHRGEEEPNGRGGLKVVPIDEED